MNFSGELKGDDYRLSESMVMAWTTFVDTGYIWGLGSWDPFQKEHKYLNISKGLPAMTSNENLQERMALWEDVMKEKEQPIVCLKTNENVCYRGSWLNTGLKNCDKYEENAAFVSFQGIQYAQAPVGDLRFKAPLPFNDQDGLHDVNKKVDILCPQFEVPDYDINDVTENCLFLNVYSPKKALDNIQNPLGVLFWIHGGALMSGSGRFDEYGPHYFMEQGDLVIVTINYRVGPLGFLSLGTKDVPGNAGFKDQIMALKWVNDNIAKFGGDPKRIAIAGESAGSASVALHLVSPLSNGLFRRAILESGTGLGPGWHPNTPKEALDQANLAIDALNCKRADDILMCLQSKGVKDLVDMKLEQASPWMAVQDKNFTNDPFLPGSVEEIFESGQFNSDIEVIIGTNTEEGILVVGPSTHGYTEWEEYRQAIEYFAPGMFFGIANSNDFTDEDFEKAKKLIDYYVGSFDNINEQHTKGVVDMFTDSLFQYGTHQTIKYLVENNVTVYQYLLTYEGEYSLSPFFEVPPHNGVCHGDDIIYTWVVKSVGLSDVSEVLGKQM